MAIKEFTPDYRNILDVLHNRRPARLPLYEHAIDPPFISKVIGRELVRHGNSPVDYEEYYREVSRFWKEMTYDSFAYEAAICEILPGHGAINGGMKGPIQSRSDFERYPFDEFPELFWKHTLRTSKPYGPYFRRA